MNRGKIIGLVVLVIIIGAYLFGFEATPKEKDNVTLPSAFNSVERCNQLRDSGFFASSYVNPGSTEVNSPQDRQNLYQNCVRNATP